jgi:hypothetical protein
MVHPGHETVKHYFPAPMGPTRFPQKARRDTLRRTCVFPSGGICGSHSAFRCVWDVKHRHTILMLGWAWCGFHKKRIRTCYCQTCVFASGGNCGSCSAFQWVQTQNVDALLFLGCETLRHYLSCSGGPEVISIKSAPGHVTPNLSFCIWWDLRVTKCSPVRPGREMLTHYFSCSDGPIAAYIKSTPRHVMPNICFCIRWELWVSSTFYCVRARNVDTLFFMLG